MKRVNMTETWPRPISIVTEVHIINALLDYRPGKRNPTCGAGWLCTCKTHPSPWKFRFAWRQNVRWPIWGKLFIILNSRVHGSTRTTQNTMLKVDWSYVESAHKYATEPKIFQYGFARNYTPGEEFSFQMGYVSFFFLGIRKWETKSDLLGLKFSQPCFWRRISSGIWCYVTAWSDPDVSTQYSVFIFNGKYAQ
jgi:hypothetical protein